MCSTYANYAIIYDICKLSDYYNCPSFIEKMYLCGCGWLYGTYFGRSFVDFMVNYEAVTMVPFLPLG